MIEQFLQRHTYETMQYTFIIAINYHPQTLTTSNGYDVIMTKMCENIHVTIRARKKKIGQLSFPKMQFSKEKYFVFCT